MNRVLMGSFFLFMCIWTISGTEPTPEERLDYFDMTLEELMNMTVVCASKFAEKPSEAPSAIVLVTRQQMETYNWESLNDVLYRQAGFGPGQDYERETVPSRGLFDSWSANHLLLLFDGVPMNDNLYGTAYTWDITPLFLAHDVEIIRGPGSALYGSNATNGVIQVNSVTAEDIKDNVLFRAEHGSLDTEVYDVIGGGQLSQVDWVVGFQSSNTEGFSYESADGSGRLGENGLPQEFTIRDDRSSTYLWTKFDFKNALEGLSFQIHEQDWSFQTGHGWLWWVPDFKESMREHRRILSIKYAPEPKGRFAQEYLVRHQRHNIRWNQRYYPDEAFDGYYPSGMWEYLDTGASDLFVRAQVAYAFNQGNFLMGVEGSRFIYDGDNEHYSNIDVDSEFFEPFPGDRNTALGPWLDFIIDHPIVNQALYAQYSSGDLFKQVRITAGVRYDRMNLDYDRIYEPGRPEAKRTFSRVSPRLSLVYLPSERLIFKFMTGKAFRAPSPTELAGAHTFSLGSNIEELKPELLDTVELAVDWHFHSDFQFRANLFRTKFENQIAYSTQNNNLSTNVFSQTSFGLEAECLYRKSGWEAFLNLSKSERENEDVLDQTIAESDNELVWNPNTKLNLGLSYATKHYTLALSGHYQSATSRRSSEIGEQELPLGVGVVLDLDQSRPTSVPAWTTVDLHANWQLTQLLQLGFNARNALDKQYSLIKTGPFPFDYQQPDRTLQFYVKVHL